VRNSIDGGGRGLFQDISGFVSEIKKAIAELNPGLYSKRVSGAIPNISDTPTLYEKLPHATYGLTFRFPA
jgi:hypothetical protein